MLLKTLQCPEQPHPAEFYLAPNVYSGASEVAQW